MKYNSITLRRKHRREKLIMGSLLFLAVLLIAIVVVIGAWLALSIIDISANAPTMAGQVPIYWEYNLINLLLKAS